MLGAAMAGTLLAGCSTPKNVAYFDDITANTILQTAQVNQIKARPGDKLMIVVKAKDAAISALFNKPSYSAKIDYISNTETGATVGAQNIPMVSEGMASYTVGPDGKIDFPMLGMLNINGMTRQEIAGFIKGELMGRDLVKDPTVTVEFMNAGVNILGSVARPGRIEVNKDELTLLDAIALAGDLQLNGRRDNVKVLRKENGQVKTYVVDLTKAQEVMKSPVYYLQQDDIVYIEPNDMLKGTTRVNGNTLTSTGFWISMATLLTTAATTVGVFVNKN